MLVIVTVLRNSTTVAWFGFQIWYMATDMEDFTHTKALIWVFQAPKAILRY